MSSSPSPTPFSVSSTAASTAGSSPPPTPPPELSDDESELPHVDVKPIKDEDFEERYQRLKFLLDKSVIYAGVLKQHMDEVKAKAVPVASSAKARRATGKTRKRLRIESGDEEDEHDAPPKRSKVAGDDSHLKQPALITGATLKDYQLEGVEWMISLDQNGISGILADEMGLGKTIQTIAFNAYLRERGFFRPFLVVCPLSVLHNWLDEFKKFAPAIPVCVYHGSPAERAELRATVMVYPDEETPSAPTKSPVRNTSAKSPVSTRARSAKSATKTSPRKGRAPRIGRKSSGGQESDHEEVDDVAEEDLSGSDSPSAQSKFPVILTTYEILMRDRPHLARYHWGYIVVDEGHRLKNFDCRLMQEMKKLRSGGRLVLSGTPLHNNLAELWSLLNFILPDIFTSIESFEDWFDLPTMQTTLSSERSAQLIHTLHAILKPFLLRRLKVDVEVGLPPKKEYLLYAPLTVRQKELYDAIVTGGLRRLLIKSGEGDQKEKKEDLAIEPAACDGKRILRVGRRSFGNVDDDDDDAWLERAANGETHYQEIRKQKLEKDAEDIGRDHQYKAALKKVNNMKLQNTVMQLRKVCSHPFLFDWPLDAQTRQPVVNEELVNVSGKMMVLERLLEELFRRGHKVLLFSQFTTMLDIIEDWATEFKGWSLCRIDGSTGPLERRDEMNRFQRGGDGPDAPRLFLLSTRAGGLGINLVAADTVIFYDQDWNPQMDIQAQDRAHRIGQTKPVLIFRLVSKHTIEEKILEKANEKRKLEALVIAKGKFKMPTLVANRGKQETMAELAASLLKLEGEKIEVVSDSGKGKAGVISDEDLDALLDRSENVFVDRGKGWTSKSAGVKKEKGVRCTKFKVYDGPVDEGNDALGRMMGEAVEC